jgi:hypothetical protein
MLRNRATSISIAALVVTAGICSTAWAGIIRHDTEDWKYIDLGLQYPNVGRFWGSDDNSTPPEPPTPPGEENPWTGEWMVDPPPQPWPPGTGPGDSWQRVGEWSGSGTLIAPNWVLTAAHVVEDATNMTFTIGGRVYEAAEFFPHAAYNTLTLANDIALVRFESNIYDGTGIEPATLYTGSSELGEVGTAVGFGVTGTGVTGEDSFDGLKRATQNVIDFFYGGAGDPSGAAAAGDVVFGVDFDNPDDEDDSSSGDAEPLELEGLVAPGDSGGGTFIDIWPGGTWVPERYLVGVTSFGWGVIDGETDFDYGDLSGHVRVSEYIDWINGIMTANPPTGGGGDGTGGTDIPEPGTLSLLALGGLAMIRRRRRRCA